MNSHQTILERGPVCECSDPRCAESLGISWEEWEARRPALQIAPTCTTGKEEARGSK